MKKIYILLLSIISTGAFAQGLISKPDKVLPMHNDDVTSLSYAPYAKLLASGSWDNAINIYSDEGTFVRTIAKHNGAVEALCFSRDGKFIFSGSNDMTAMQFEVSTGKSINMFQGHTGNVTAITVDAANKFLFTGCYDGNVRMFDLSQGGQLAKTIAIGSPVHGITIANDGKSFYVCADSKDLLQYDMGGKEIKRFSGHTDFINAVAMSLNSKYLVTASNDKSLILWDAKSGAKLKTYTGHTLKVNCVIFSYDGKYIISGSNDGTCKVWSTEGGNELYTYNDNLDIKIRAALVSFDKKRIYTSGKVKTGDHGVRLWTFPVDTLEKNAPKTIIGTGNKDEKNNGLQNNENRATKPATPPPAKKPESNPSSTKNVNDQKKLEPENSIETVETEQVTMVADSEQIKRTGKTLPADKSKPGASKTGTTSKTADPAKPANTGAAKPAENGKSTNTANSSPAKTADPTTPAGSQQKPAEITGKTPANAANTKPMTKAEKIKQAQLEKEQKEKEEKERIEKANKAAADSLANEQQKEEEEKPKSKFRKLR